MDVNDVEHVRISHLKSKSTVYFLLTEGTAPCRDLLFPVVNYTAILIGSLPAEARCVMRWFRPVNMTIVGQDG